MRTRLVEFSVGGFMVAGFAALVMLAFQVSGLTLKSAEDVYHVYAQFDDLGGLSVRGKVSVAGVTVGKISDIRLDSKSYNALVEMEIYRSVNELPKDSIASIQTAGLLGEKYISISPGAEEEFLKEGDTLFDTQSALNIEKLISNFASSKLGQ
ncbi:MAG: outer membrane lipid asymmetry maintenance protein MlaD [Hahellaceae bacterium]|nr:outer membrane lipid asymmetry maintenance protein MlaD [Hahellaceae bacterium]MCP5169045.1 outer membrane lipid asymmetry maintenance protein MlaD [Hahellaceae bacterium]